MSDESQHDDDKSSLKHTIEQSPTLESPSKLLKTQSPTPQPIPQLNTQETAQQTTPTLIHPPQSTPPPQTQTQTESTQTPTLTQQPVKIPPVKTNKPNYEVIDGSKLRKFLNKYITGDLLICLNEIWKLKEKGDLKVNDDDDDSNVLIKLGELLIELGMNKKKNTRMEQDTDTDTQIKTEN
ncbi:hypothetical protein CANARDRAFT_25969 [[Candida] arabinofermentans NRRL YB-2248]|uniref:Uncharacterized protein n=1 Tax=[Candida] arabinofermentans NRRL YB-2248 TaxID=983967 RepID=A0A1E4T7L1_9ASCO|nr:hypothetical protein CANARDRAFT_25969 [[Candida] arabinofermentans NRRL YB-2248]